MRTRKPRIDLVGFENEHSVVVRPGSPNRWIVTCKHCGKEHEQVGREIKNNAHYKKCKEYRPHNYSGLERWDAIIRRTYGITLSEYDEMLEKQGGGCAICGASTDVVSGRRLAIDHCHDSNKVRGVLCSSCNQGLGLYKDNPRLLIKAAEYLYANAR